jgi:hypothetical protein
MRRCWVLKGERRVPQPHCCPTMTEQANLRCEEHPIGLKCPNLFVYYSPAFREYGVVNHSEHEIGIIDFCPWCAARLPMTLRDRGFEELSAIGIDPWVDEVPEEFLSSAWWSIECR